jgi:ribonuclease-3
MAAPDLEKLENPDFIVEQEKAETDHGDGSPDHSRLATTDQENRPHDPSPLDELTLDDITATPREKSREEIIAEAEAAAFQDS